MRPMMGEGDQDVDTCARCGVELAGPRIIVLHGSLVIMYCTKCGKNEAHAVKRSGTHALRLDLVAPKSKTSR
jgi:hypothetical protein